MEHICPLCGELFWQVISREEAWKLYIKKLQDESECFLFTFFCVLCIKMDIEKLQVKVSFSFKILNRSSRVKSIKDWHIAVWLQMELQACGLRIDRRQYKSVIVDKVCADLSFFHPQNLLLPRGQ